MLTFIIIDIDHRIRIRNGGKYAGQKVAVGSLKTGNASENETSYIINYK